MTSANIKPYTIKKYRASAIKLRNDIKLHKNDLDWISNHNTIVYAVDNDIAKLFSKPKQIALDSKYTKIFNGDKPINTISLGKVLSHFIFYKLRGETEQVAPKLLIPPLDKEFSRIFQAVFNEATKECKSAKKNAEVIDVMLNCSNLSDIDLAKKLVKQAPEILDVLYGENSSTAEFRKLCALIDNYKLTSLVEITSNNTEGLPENFVATYLKKKSISEMIWASTLKEEWIAKLDKPKLSSKKRENIADDAEALASLQLINARLANTGVRFVMITGASNILRTAENIKVMDGEKSCSFAELWLRHPRCFLGDSNIINTSLSNNKDNELMEILNGFLADNSSKKLEKNIINIEEKISAEYSREITEFQNAWNKFSANICLDYSTTLEKASWHDEAAINLIKKIRSAEGGLRALLKESWKSVFLAAIQTGFLYSWSLEKSRSRNLPMLMFEDFHDASEFVREILAYPPGSIIDDFQKKMKKVRCDNSKEYTTYLVFGVLFAAQNNWHIADTLADYSLKIIFPDPTNPLDVVRANSDRTFTGREGFYLKAIAGWHLAKTASDLTDAHKSIFHAIEVLKLERDIRADILSSDTRFQYELCCINIAALMFERFLNDTASFYKRLTPDQIKTSLLSILETTQNNPEKPENYVFLCSRKLTSLFVVELTLIQDIGNAFPSNLLQHIQMFREFFKNEQRANPTTLTKVVFSIVDWWGETNIDDKNRKQKIAIIEIRKSRLNFKEGISIPYEPKWHDYFEEFVSFQVQGS